MTAFPNVHHACAAPWRPKYTWDPDEPRLTRVQGPGGIDVSYSYDSAGRMLTRVSGGVTTTFEWDGWTLVKETTGSVVTRYVAPQGQLHSFERGGQVYQVHSDGHNGSVRAITDSSGAVVAHYEFDAWGAQLGSSSPFSGGFAFGYVGSLGVRTDATTGLIYMRHRWFDPNGLQRFLSRDVLDRVNRYAYGSNNPTQWIDPFGLDEESFSGLREDPARTNRLMKMLTNLDPDFRHSMRPKLDAMMDKGFKVKYGRPMKPGLHGYAADQSILINTYLPDYIAIFVLFHEYLHHAAQRGHGCVPENIRGKEPSVTLEDTRSLGKYFRWGVRAHAWIYIEEAMLWQRLKPKLEKQLSPKQFADLRRRYGNTSDRLYEQVKLYANGEGLSDDEFLDNAAGIIGQYGKLY